LSYVTILITEDAGVRTITLNRPERRNAMTPEMQLELISALEEAAAGSCRVRVWIWPCCKA
jgi:methylglutaconyl-CoA hydratase